MIDPRILLAAALCAASLGAAAQPANRADTSAPPDSSTHQARGVEGRTAPPGHERVAPTRERGDGYGPTADGAAVPAPVPADRTERAAQALDRRAEAEEPRDAQRRRRAEAVTIESDPERRGHADGMDAGADGRPDDEDGGR